MVGKSPAAPAISQSIRTPTVEESATRRKSIILFSDGTGNSSGKLFKTNVWRMYEAVDLGLPVGNDPVQIAYYDNGIGTSKIKAWALFTGIFGIGLKRNMLAIYRFVCRNYEYPDRIYCFGFSRGAFTIRLVAAMIATKGIVKYETEEEFEAWTLDVLREYCAESNPNLIPLSKVTRWVRDRYIGAKRFFLGPRPDRPLQKTKPVPVTFLGVWDTVAAYGGPSAEITRAIDNFIHPLTMNDHKLCPLIRRARHALAIDDERDSFHPVLWDEVAWNRVGLERWPGNDAASVAALERHNDRLQQVWFAGMHSDVGGGYPDESLSYVSLLWMMGEAKKAKLRLLPDHLDRVRTMSNSLGPVHDSRSGLASYYRYQPRKIAAFLHPDSGMNYVDRTLSFRDPLQKDWKGRLRSCKIHESVAARIAFGTDDYAPIILPRRVEVTRYSKVVSGGGGNPHISQNFRDDLAKGDPAFARRQEALYDGVFLRRCSYFLTVVFTLALVAMPLYAHRLMLPRTMDNRWFFQRLSDWVDYLVPNMFRPWLQSFDTAPLTFLLLVLAIGFTTYRGRRRQAAIRTEMRELWKMRIRRSAVPHAPDRSPLERFRNSDLYQLGLQWFKWLILPGLVGLFLFLPGIIYLATIVATQVDLSLAERKICVRAGPPQAIPNGRGYDFSTGEMCNPTRTSVLKDHRYAIEFVVPKDRAGNTNWSDGDAPASPEGLSASKLGFWGYVGTPLRRITTAGYLQPLYQVRPPDKDAVLGRTNIVRALKMVQTADVGNCLIYRGDFTPSETGELFLYVNDAALAGWRRTFYDNNSGTARVFLYDWHGLPTVGYAGPSTEEFAAAHC